MAAALGLKPSTASWAGEYSTKRDSTAAAVTPRKPTAAAGTGSTMRPAITVTNSDRYHQLYWASPDGGGSSAIVRPMASGKSAASTRWLVDGRDVVGNRCGCSCRNANE